MLDFSRAIALFLSSETELAAALGVPVGDVRAYRSNPQRTPARIMTKLGYVLIERGKGMQRVGELIVKESEET